MWFKHTDVTETNVAAILAPVVKLSRAAVIVYGSGVCACAMHWEQMPYQSSFSPNVYQKNKRRFDNMRGRYSYALDPIE